MKTILDRSFQYIPSKETDLKKTFARIRRILAEQEQARTQADAKAPGSVSKHSKNVLSA